MHVFVILFKKNAPKLPVALASSTKDLLILFFSFRSKLGAFFA